MNQLEAFRLIADQIASDFIKGHVPPEKAKLLRKAYRVLKNTIRKREVATAKRERRLYAKI